MNKERLLNKLEGLLETRVARIKECLNCELNDAQRIAMGVILADMWNEGAKAGLQEGLEIGHRAFQAAYGDGDTTKQETN